MDIKPVKSKMDTLLFKLLLLLFSFFYIAIAKAAPEAAHQFMQAVKTTTSTPMNQREILFTAPPRGKKDMETYTPIVGYLSKTLNRPVRYIKPTSWFRYSKSMWADQADIVFDGPHFNSWRRNNLGHRIIVKLPQKHIWKAIVLSNSHYKTLDELIGLPVCLQGLTNFAKLTFFHHYKNPARQPIHIQIRSRADAYAGVLKEKCVAAVVSAYELDTYNQRYIEQFPERKIPVRVLHEHPAFPNQAFSVSAKLGKSLQHKIQQALFSHAGQQAMAKLRARYAKGERLVKPTLNEYAEVDVVLEDTYGYGYDFKKPVLSSYGVAAAQKKSLTTKSNKARYLELVSERD